MYKILRKETFILGGAIYEDQKETFNGLLFLK